MQYVVLLVLLLTVSEGPAFAADVLGSNFADDLAAAGLTGLPFSWVKETGAISYGNTITPEQHAAIEAVKAAHVPVAATDVVGFQAWLKANLPWSLLNKVEKAYPGFVRDLAARHWTEFQNGCIEANAAVPLSSAQWTAFKNAVATYKIPVTLP